MIPPAKRKAILRVIGAIVKYRGGVIHKGRHPLWRAVVALERMSVRRSGRHRLLDSPASRYWFRGLWASRPGMRNVPIDRLYEFDAELPTHADPALAQQWMMKLLATLTKWLERDSIAPDASELLHDL